MIDATHLKAHRTAASLRLKSRQRPHDWPDKRRPQHETACCGGGFGRLFMTLGHRSDDTGARALLRDFPAAGHLLADRGHDADWFRSGLEEKGISLVFLLYSGCIPSCKTRKQPIPHDTERYKSRHEIEVMFGRLKDWCRVATRYDRSPTVFLSAIALSATVIFWL